MALRPIRTRTQVANLVSPYSPSRACERMIEYDNFEVLGGFAAPGTLPEDCLSFAVKVWSEFGRVWYLWLTIDPDLNKVYVREGGPPDWTRWVGINVPFGPRWQLASGDCPEKYVVWYHDSLKKEKEGEQRKGSAE